MSNSSKFGCKTCNSSLTYSSTLDQESNQIMGTNHSIIGAGNSEGFESDLYNVRQKNVAVSPSECAHLVLSNVNKSVTLGGKVKNYWEY